MTTLPATMTGIAIDRPGGPEVLVARSVAVPRPGPGQLLMKVAAAGVNRPDVLQRSGSYPPPKGHSELPGLEAAGEVVALGEGVKRWKAGDEVTALLNGGGYAEYCLVEEGAALPVPAGLSMVEAAAIPETYFTVWHNVFQRGGLKPGDWLLVHGGSSGIGTCAIQLGKAFGAHVIATAGSKAKCEACLALGADRAVDYSAEDFVAVSKAATAGKGCDVILDMVGGDYIRRNIEAAASDGCIVQIGFQKPSKVELDVMPIMLKRLTFTGSTLRIRTNEFKAGLARSLEQKVWPLLAAGRCKPVLDQTFPLREAAAAHRRMEGGQHIGKIMLVV